MKRRRILTAVGIVLAVVCILSTVAATLLTRSSRSGSYAKYTEKTEPGETYSVNADGQIIAPDGSIIDAAGYSVDANGRLVDASGNVVSAAEAPTKSAINFRTLLKENNDVIAWLRINGTAVDYPVLFRAGDNEYYLRRDLYGQYSKAGSLFVEDYNTPDFTDPVTIIYGHHLSSGEMFGRLQATYTNAEQFQKCKEIVVYCSEKELHYKVFCAVPLDNAHILYYHDFNNEKVFDSYFDDVFQVRSLQAVFDQSEKPQAGDRVLMLSTCFSSDYSRRFVVMARLTDEIVYS